MPFDQSVLNFIIERYFQSGNVERMHTGAGIVVPMISSFLEMNSIFRHEPEGLQAHLRQRKILEYCPVCMAGNDGGDAPVIVGRPFVEAFIHLIAEARIRGGAGRVFHTAPL